MSDYRIYVPTAPGKYTLNLPGKEPKIDMKQFLNALTDIPYARLSGSQILDIIYPDKGIGPYPVIVLIHGGGWNAGDKGMQNSQSLLKIPSQGYVLISVNYRLSPEALWPAQLYDCKTAIRFIRANAKKYNLKTDNILVWGNSAGGQLAEMLAATNGRPEFEDLTMGADKESSAVQGVVAWYGVSDMLTLAPFGAQAANQVLGCEARRNTGKASLASPITYITKDYPPILLVHGTNDQVVPYEQSVRFYHKVNKIAGMGRAQIKLIQGADHSDPRIKTDDNVKDNLFFVDQILWNGNNPFRTDSLPEIHIKKTNCPNFEKVVLS